jgi:hypothetical protein
VGKYEGREGSPRPGCPGREGIMEGAGGRTPYGIGAPGGKEGGKGGTKPGGGKEGYCEGSPLGAKFGANGGSGGLPRYSLALAEIPFGLLRDTR